MKRLLKISAVLALVLVATAAAAMAPMFIGRRTLVDGVDLNGIRIVKDGIVSIAMVPAGEGKVVLIDAGNDRSGKAVLAELSRRNLTADAVLAILLTHGHLDHTAGIAAFPKAQVMALAAEVALVEGRAGAHGPLTQLFPVHPTGVNVARALQDGETITLGPTQVQVFAVPGHTAGSAAYLVNGVLFLGDAADATSDGAIRGAAWVVSDSQVEDRASLVRLEQRLEKDEIPVRAIAFAHSGALTVGLAPLAAFAAAEGTPQASR